MLSATGSRAGNQRPGKQVAASSSTCPPSPSTAVAAFTEVKGSPSQSAMELPKRSVEPFLATLRCLLAPTDDGKPRSWLTEPGSMGTPPLSAFPAAPSPTMTPSAECAPRALSPPPFVMTPRLRSADGIKRAAGRLLTPPRPLNPPCSISSSRLCMLKCSDACSSSGWSANATLSSATGSSASRFLRVPHRGRLAWSMSR
mmetsp:Transcript_6863/g.12458  ORF Transcript_6863/g.12458 Transcript_6863/m.12458 type:complete len:200 (-) Transcript_6863:966-1565(-)